MASMPRYRVQLWLQMVLGVPCRWCVVAESIQADGVGATEGCCGTGGVSAGVGADVVGANGVSSEGIGFVRALVL